MGLVIMQFYCVTSPAKTYVQTKWLVTECSYFYPLARNWDQNNDVTEIMFSIVSL